MLDRQLHDTAIDEACEGDRLFGVANPGVTSRVRELQPHELCPPGGPCDDRPGLVQVVYLVDGVRARMRLELGTEARA